jgi:hypothetical protein
MTSTKYFEGKKSLFLKKIGIPLRIILLNFLNLGVLKLRMVVEYGLVFLFFC